LKRILTELLFAAGLAAIVWLLVHLGLRSVGHALAAIGPGGIVLVTLAHLPTLVLLGLAWRMLAHADAGAHAGRFVWARLMRDTGGELLPFSQLGGIAIGARALALTGVRGLEAAVASVLDTIVEQVAKTPYSLAAVGLLIWLVPGSPLAGPALAVVGLSLGLMALLAVRRDFVRAQLIKMVGRLDRAWRGAASEGPGQAEAAVAETLSTRRRMVASLVLHAAAWGLGAVETWVALRLLGADITLAEAAVIDGLYVTVRTFAFAVPAALGIQEGAYVVLCGLFGVDAPTALAFSLVRRARDLLLGAPALFAWHALERRRRRLA
jgi:putative membrane protein